MTYIVLVGIADKRSIARLRAISNGFSISFNSRERETIDRAQVERVHRTPELYLLIIYWCKSHLSLGKRGNNIAVREYIVGKYSFWLSS